MGTEQMSLGILATSATVMGTVAERQGHQDPRIVAAGQGDIYRTYISFWTGDLLRAYPGPLQHSLWALLTKGKNNTELYKDPASKHSLNLF